MRIVIELELLFRSIRSDGKKKTMGKKNPWFCLLHSRCVIRSDNYPVTQLLPPASLELAIIWLGYGSAVLRLGFSAALWFLCCVSHIRLLSNTFPFPAVLWTFSELYSRATDNIHNRFPSAPDYTSTEVLPFAHLNGLRSLFFFRRWLKKVPFHHWCALSVLSGCQTAFLQGCLTWLCNELFFLLLLTSKISGCLFLLPNNIGGLQEDERESFSG